MRKLRKNAEEAVKSAGINARVEKVSDIKAIIGFGVMMTPALVIDGEVRLPAKFPHLRR